MDWLRYAAKAVTAVAMAALAWLSLTYGVDFGFTEAQVYGAVTAMLAAIGPAVFKIGNGPKPKQANGAGRPPGSALALLVILLLPLGACAQYDVVSGVVKERGAAFYDKTLVESEFVICQAASVGSVQRRYGQTDETAAAWRKLCSPPAAELIGPPD